jgi:hypothetical protein
LASHPLHTTIRQTSGGFFYEKSLSLGPTILQKALLLKHKDEIVIARQINTQYKANYFLLTAVKRL